MAVKTHVMMTIFGFLTGMVVTCSQASSSQNIWQDHEIACHQCIWISCDLGEESCEEILEIVSSLGEDYIHINNINDGVHPVCPIVTDGSYGAEYSTICLTNMEMEKPVCGTIDGSVEFKKTKEENSTMVYFSILGCPTDLLVQLATTNSTILDIMEEETFVYRIKFETPTLSRNICSLKNQCNAVPEYRNTKVITAAGTSISSSDEANSTTTAEGEDAKSESAIKAWIPILIGMCAFVLACLVGVVILVIYKKNCL